MNMRRINDVLIALALITICLPALVLSCIALWLEQSTFPITTRERVTRDGRIVRIYVLQTAKPTGFSSRTTAIGEFLRRLHLDHIPQLFNVLNGELSFATGRPSLDDAIGAKSLLAVREP